MDQPLDNITFESFRDPKGLELAITFLNDAEYTDDVACSKLMERGYTDFQANSLIRQAKEEIARMGKSKAMRNIIVGAAFLVIGTGLTLANIGFIFWGAIVFGGIQMIQGIVGLSNGKGNLD